MHQLNNPFILSCPINGLLPFVTDERLQGQNNCCLGLGASRQRGVKKWQAGYWMDNPASRWRVLCGLDGTLIHHGMLPNLLFAFASWRGTEQCEKCIKDGLLCKWFSLRKEYSYLRNSLLFWIYCYYLQINC